MLQSLRHERILNELKDNRAVKVTDLAKKLNISESTVRRDINELSLQGKLKKVFGGAIPLGNEAVTMPTAVADRENINVDEKEKIARYAATLIEDGDFVYIDAGTTTCKMIDYIENSKATYVTNGIVNAGKLVQKGFDVCIVGGIVRSMTEAAIGVAAIETVKKYNFTKCFMGANGIDINKGFTTPDISEAAVKAAVMERSAEAFILADHDKFDVVSAVTFASIEDACIITNDVGNPIYIEEAIIKKVE